jgi:protein-S-isoprenylcysteine O-methyltransferase Ste14
MMVPILAFLLVIRIGIKEKTLRMGLKGYDDYARRRWRLVPLIW